MMSILIATVAIPAAAARDPSPRRGVRRMLLGLLAFDALYLAYVALLHAGWHAPGHLAP